MRNNVFLLTCVALLFIVDLSRGGTFILTVPSEPRFDSTFVATVTAVGVTEREMLHLEYVALHSTKEQTLHSTDLTFYTDGVKTWDVVFSQDKITGSKVDLIMTIPDKYIVKTKTLNFSKDSGYIFIQTDKPLYSPRQTVKFRILAVDENQKLSKYPLKVDILNDQKIVVDRMRYTAEEAFKGQEFELPQETPSGIWSINAVYEDSQKVYSAHHTVYFEVREYVLPQFYSFLNISEDVVTEATEWITLTVQSRYIYGRPVMGMVEIRLGVWEPKTPVKYLNYHVFEELQNGEIKKDIRISKLLPKGSDFLKARRLYVNVNVTEFGTLENDTIEDSSTFIAHPYYELTYNKSKSTFKPGFPYTYKMQSRAKSGRPSTWIQAYISVFYYSSLETGARKKYLTNHMSNLDRNGEMQWEIETPPDAEKLVFKAAILDLKQPYMVYSTTVMKGRSRNNQYLHISMQEDVGKNGDGVVLLRYTPHTGGWHKVLKITVSVLAKGQVLFSTSAVRNTDGRSTVRIPHRYYRDLTPKMRVVAYYHMDKPLAETVIDSLVVDTEDICISELELHKPGGLWGDAPMTQPKDNYTLSVTGGPKMRVGLLAVDKAVYLLNDKKTLTRESMFEQLGSHDLGTGNGDGNNMDEMFKNSGITYIIADSSNLDDVGVIRGSKQASSQGKHGSLFDFGLAHKLNFYADKGPSLSDAPPHTVRKYFPESWLFDEFTLPISGHLSVNTIMPDSITTWSFMAVGISAMRGVCVSHPIETKVQRSFFADLRMPNKVTRLEVVKVRIAIYNFREEKVSLYGQVSGSGVCFPTERQDNFNENGTSFILDIDKHSTEGLVVKMIPLRNGELTIRLDVALKNDPTRDVVERKLYVEAEGLRVRKSITFVLDPEAKHAKFKPIRNNKIYLSRTATVTNLFNLRTKKQETKINLALPIEVIRGTERCRISAFGDLMGDIINHAVIQSRSLMDQPVLDAEEVLGDLGPTMHALLYTNKTGLLDTYLATKGRRFVRHSVARLLNYRNGDAFSLKANSKSKPATWLTAFVLKTLCRASSLAFIDQENIIDNGFKWILESINQNGTLKEEDWRLANDTFEYRIMLSADVLIALLECGIDSNTEDVKEDRLNLEAEMAFFLEDHLGHITQPMILAKVTYALNLFDAESDATEIALRRLLATKRTNNLGHSYWANEQENTESKKIPFWYHRGVKASSIEGTAFALMVFLEQPGTDVDAIADWLVAQRNENGAFIGAMDSTAAIQALAMYSSQKRGIELDLHCNVSSAQVKGYSHFFKFTQKNAMRVEAVNDVPVGKILKVSTQGKGLGQMQVNVEYNIPIEKNQYCPFKVEVKIKHTKATMTNLNKGPLCLSCGIGCPKEEGNSTEVNRRRLATAGDTYHIERKQVKSRVAPAVGNNRISRRKWLGQTRKNSRKSSRSRKPRSYNIRQHPSASKKAVCFHICLQHLLKSPSGPVSVDIEMLSGYNPVEIDWKLINEVPNVKGVEYIMDSAVLRVFFSKIDSNTNTCFGFRARDDLEVGRPAPASVVIKQEGVPYPVCSLEYKPPEDVASLQVFCADISDNNRGECRCYSGLCGSCRPYRSEIRPMNLDNVRKLTCSADIAYHLEMVKWEDQNQWFEIDAKVKAVNKTVGTHDLNEGDIIKLRTPSSCHCPVREYKDLSSAQSFYLLSHDVEKLTDKIGKTQYRYLIDERSRIFRVTQPGQSVAEGQLPAIKHSYLKYGLNNC